MPGGASVAEWAALVQTTKTTDDGAYLLALRARIDALPGLAYLSSFGEQSQPAQPRPPRRWDYDSWGD